MAIGSPARAPEMQESRYTLGISAGSPGRRISGVTMNRASWLRSCLLVVAVCLMSLPAAAAEPEEPRALAGRGGENLEAFARLLGYVRHFHPSDEVAAVGDWDRRAIEGIRAAEPAADPADLARRLEAWARPFGATIRVYRSDQPASLPDALAAAPKGDAFVVTWEHQGFGPTGILGNRATIYRGRRVYAKFKDGRCPKESPDPAVAFRADLGGGVSCLIPIALYADTSGTLPKDAESKPKPSAQAGKLSGNDRSTRLAAVALGWNIIQHFYPYFDVGKCDWPAELRRALASAATDPDEAAFLETLRRMVAALNDGHGGVYLENRPDVNVPPAYLPLAWDWVEDRLVVTAARKPDGPTTPALDIRPGDVVRSIDGVPAATALERVERLVASATPQWRRARGLSLLSGRKPGQEAVLDVQGRDGHVRTVRVKPVPRGANARGAVTEPRPSPIAELKPGIYYIDFTRAEDQALRESLPKFKEAKGLIFDCRGYPNSGFFNFFPHLSDQAMTSPQWHVPVVTRPDRQGMTFSRGGEWDIQPAEPYLKAPKAFLTGGGAISYAESCMGIIEHYKLGAIVGGPTAGTNGNVNTSIHLPGGYRILWTGMKVLKHDGSRHHGVGIRPTVPVERTIAGIAAGRDEVLEKALTVVEGR
jgi:C-terminal processing protease CtpA/Prc